MGTLGMVALILGVVVVLLLVGLVAFAMSQRRKQPGSRHRSGPRTVAELVQQRGGDPDHAPSAAAAPEAAADAPAEADEAPEVVEPAQAEHAPAEAESTAATVADDPDAGIPDEKGTPESAPPATVGVDGDTPWARAARMKAGTQDETPAATDEPASAPEKPGRGHLRSVPSPADAEKPTVGGRALAGMGIAGAALAAVGLARSNRRSEPAPDEDAATPAEPVAAQEDPAEDVPWLDPAPSEVHGAEPGAELDQAAARGGDARSEEPGPDTTASEVEHGAADGEADPVAPDHDGAPVPGAAAGAAGLAVATDLHGGDRQSVSGEVAPAMDAAVEPTVPEGGAPAIDAATDGVAGAEEQAAEVEPDLAGPVAHDATVSDVGAAAEPVGSDDALHTEQPATPGIGSDSAIPAGHEDGVPAADVARVLDTDQRVAADVSPDPAAHHDGSPVVGAVAGVAGLAGLSAVAAHPHDGAEPSAEPAAVVGDHRATESADAESADPVAEPADADGPLDAGQPVAAGSSPGSSPGPAVAADPEVVAEPGEAEGVEPVVAEDAPDETPHAPEPVEQGSATEPVVLSPDGNPAAPAADAEQPAEPDHTPALLGLGVAGAAGLAAVAAHGHGSGGGDEQPGAPDVADGGARPAAEAASPDHADDHPAGNTPAGDDPEEDKSVEQPDTAERGVSAFARRTPAEQAAEHAAVDVALLRTFGVADPGSRPDEAAIVSLAGVGDHTAASAHGGPPVAVAVHVVDRSHTGVAGATVTLVDDHGQDAASARSDGDGHAELTAPGPGTYMLVSSAPGHQPGASGVVVGDGPVDAEVLLVRSSSVRGSVWGPDGAVAGAGVSLVQDGEVVDSVESGADGGYRISDLAAGSYGLSVTAPGCEPLASVLSVLDATDVRHDIDLEAARLADLS